MKQRELIKKLEAAGFEFPDMAVIMMYMFVVQI